MWSYALVLAALYALSLMTGCGDEDAEGAGAFPLDCLGLSVADAEACAEAQFWPSFQDNFDDGKAVFHMMTPGHQRASWRDPGVSTSTTSGRDHRIGG